QRGKASRARRGFDVRSRGREGQDLRVDTEVLQDLLAVIDIAMAGDGDVVVAGIVDARIAVVVDVNLHGAARLAERGEVGGRIVVVVKVNDGHVEDAARCSRQAILTRRGQVRAGSESLPGGPALPLASASKRVRRDR